MEPRELFLATVDCLPNTDSEIPEYEQGENPWDDFKKRLACTIDEIEQMPEEIRRILGISLVADTEVRPVDDYVEKEIRRCVQFEIYGGPDLSALAGDNSKVKVRITIGTCGISRKRGFEPESEFRGRPVSSCDIVTELFLDYDDRDIPGDEAPKDPFYDFQFLERTNWRYPVFRSDDELSPNEPSGDIATTVTINREAFIKAEAKAFDKNTNGQLLSGMEASLAELKNLLDSPF